MKNAQWHLNLTFLLMLVLPCAYADSGEKIPLELADMQSLRDPSQPRISPDSSQIAFVEGDRIYLTSAAMRGARPLTASTSSASDPRWSADGNYLYFVSDRGETTQLWRLPTDRFGEAEQLSDFEHGISSTQLSPDETRVLLELSDNDLQEENADDEAPPPPFVVSRRQFKQDYGDGYLTAGTSSHLYVYDIDASALQQITSGPYEESDASWSPDGGSIVFVSNRETDFDATYRSDIYTVPAREGADARRLTNNSAAKHSPAFSPDGSQIAYIDGGDGVYSVQHIVLVPADGGDARILTSSLDRWVQAFEFSANGRWIYFNYDDAGAVHLARVRLSDGRIERLIEGDVSVERFDVGTDTTLAVTMNGPADSADVYLLQNRRLTELTDLNRDFFDEHLLGEQRKLSFESSDGTLTEAFITLPPDYVPGRRYPAILNIHGGPIGQFAWGFSFRAQFLAANGYVVIEPNPRGSTGFGEEYIRAIYRTWGITDYDDIIAAVDHVVEAGIADPERLAVTGYSYGGYMTNVVITSTDRFKAAASGAGHSLIEANFGHDIYQQWYVWELGVPWENREKYDLLSPFLRAGNVKTPTIFLGGRVDWNVPILNAELMYQALTVRGIDSELVVYPDTHHGGWAKEYEQDYLQRILDWFDRYLMD